MDSAGLAKTDIAQRIVFRFLISPAEVVGDSHVEGLKVVHAGARPNLSRRHWCCGRSAIRGHRSIGVPFDKAIGIVPNENARVLGDDGQPIPGMYVTGRIERGPRGVIGTNRSCVEETLAQPWEDFDAGGLARDVKDRAALLEVLAERGVDPVDWQGWRAIDVAERRHGAEASRPRVKFVDIRDMLAAARN